jgi:hypothetical protein
MHFSYKVQETHRLGEQLLAINNLAKIHYFLKTFLTLSLPITPLLAYLIAWLVFTVLEPAEFHCKEMNRKASTSIDTHTKCSYMWRAATGKKHILKAK